MKDSEKTVFEIVRENKLDAFYAVALLCGVGLWAVGLWVLFMWGVGQLLP